MLSPHVVLLVQQQGGKSERWAYMDTGAQLRPQLHVGQVVQRLPASFLLQMQELL